MSSLFKITRTNFEYLKHEAQTFFQTQRKCDRLWFSAKINNEAFITSQFQKQYKQHHQNQSICLVINLPCLRSVETTSVPLVRLTTRVSLSALLSERNVWSRQFFPISLSSPCYLMGNWGVSVSYQSETYSINTYPMAP